MITSTDVELDETEATRKLDRTELMLLPTTDAPDPENRRLLDVRSRVQRLRKKRESEGVPSTLILAEVRELLNRELDNGGPLGGIWRVV